MSSRAIHLHFALRHLTCMRALGWEIGLVLRRGGRRPWLRHKRLLGRPCLPGAVVLQRQRALSGQAKALHAFSSRSRVLGRARARIGRRPSRRRCDATRAAELAPEGELAQGLLDRGARKNGLFPRRRGPF